MRFKASRLLWTSVIGLSALASTRAASDEAGLLEPWRSRYGSAVDHAFTGGPISFAHLPHKRCLDDPDARYDVAIFGAPFDGAVTYRPGARFGPAGIRAGSRRQSQPGGYGLSLAINPYSHLTALDCGDAPLNPFDPAVAIDQAEAAYATLLKRPLPDGHTSPLASLAFDGVAHPIIALLGGDHTIVLPTLRALHKVYGPISVVHFDAHIDTWDFSKRYKSEFSKQASINHGSAFHIAAQEGLIGPSTHIGIRCRGIDVEHAQHDKDCQFDMLTTDFVDDHGADAAARRAVERIGQRPAYISLDIDVFEPAMAPASGTLEPGGLTVREVRRILRGLGSLNLVGFDIVEVAPAYDTAAELTTILASDMVHHILSVIARARVDAADHRTVRTEL